MAIFQCDLLKNSKNRCIAIAMELFFVFFRREKNKHNGASYLLSFTKWLFHKNKNKLKIPKAIVIPHLMRNL